MSALVEGMAVVTTAIPFFARGGRARDGHGAGARRSAHPASVGRAVPVARPLAGIGGAAGWPRLGEGTCSVVPSRAVREACGCSPIYTKRVRGPTAEGREYLARWVRIAGGAPKNRADRVGERGGPKIVPRGVSERSRDTLGARNECGGWGEECPSRSLCV